jgi:Xaa-Pro aminopeptidase
MKKPRPQTPSNRLGSYSDSFKDFITRGWAPYPSDPRPPLVAHEHARRRCQELSAQFPHDRLIIPAGGYKVRSNDCDYRYRAHSGFAYLSGLGNETEPDSVLVIEDGTPTLFFHGRVERSDPEFYSSSQYGEMWVGSRPSIEDMVSYT